MTMQSIKTQKIVRLSFVCIVMLILAIVLKSDTFGKETESIPTTQTSVNNILPPEQVFENFKKAIKGTPNFKLSCALKPDEVKEQLKAWEKELGVHLKPIEISYLELIKNHHDLVSIPGINDVFLCRSRTRKSSLALKYLVLDGRSLTYEIPDEQLSEFDFKVLGAVEIIDPINNMLPELKVNKESLLSFIERLCKLGKLEYVIKANQSDEVNIIMQLHNTTIANSLIFAAKATGYKINFQRDNTIMEPRNFNQIVYLNKWDISQQLFNKFETSERKSDFVINLLHDKIISEAKQMLTNRPIAVFVK